MRDKAHRIRVEFKVLKYSLEITLSRTPFSSDPTKFKDCHSRSEGETIEYASKISEIFAIDEPANLWSIGFYSWSKRSFEIWSREGDSYVCICLVYCFGKSLGTNEI